MPGFFEALKNRSAPEPKKYFLNVDGKTYQVSFQKKLWAKQYNEKDLTIKDGQIVLKKKSFRATYKVLTKSDTGYFFESDDIHWPNKIAEGGVTWQTKSE